MPMESPRTRRQMLALMASGSVAGGAGCLGNSSESDSPEETQSTPTPEPTVPDVNCNPEDYPSLSNEPPKGAWSPTRGNQRRTGANLEIDSLILEDTEQLQAIKLFSDSSVSLPAIADGIAYLTNDGMDYAIDVETGETLWSYETSWLATPIITRDTVYLSGYGVSLYAVSRADGSLRWATTLDYDGFVETLPVIGADNILCPHFDRNGSEQSRLTALDLKCGQERWTTKLEHGRHQGLATDNETVYAATDHHLYALDAESGTKHWVTKINDVDIRTPPALADETVIVEGGGDIHALATADGSVHWSTRNGPTAKHLPTVAEGRVFLVEDDPVRVHALELGTGETQWTFTDVPQGIYTRLTYVAGNLYGFESNIGLIALDAQTGQNVAQVELPHLDATTSWGTISELAITSSGIFVHSHKTEAGTPEHVHRFYW